MVCLFYIQEKSNKEDFIKLVKQQNDLQGWKLLLDQVIPCSVSVINNLDVKSKNIHFTNKMSKDIFGIQDSQQNQNLYEQLTQIEGKQDNKNKNLQQIIEQTFEKLYKQQENLSQNIISQQQFGKIDENFQTENKNIMTNRDYETPSSILLKNQQKSENQFQNPKNVDKNNKQNTSINNQLNNNNKNQLHGEFYFWEEISLHNFSHTKKEMDSQNNLKIQQNFYDIKIVQCLWEGIPSIMLILIDITQKIKNQHLKEVQAYKDLTLAQITHDLKTPLNGMICQLQSTETGTNYEEYSSVVNITLKNAFLLLSVINDLLDHSQLLKGKLRIVPVKFDLIQLIEEVIELFQPQADLKDIKLIIENKTNNEFDMEIFNDQNRLKQILLNLISNAFKFTFSGNIKIIIDDNYNNNKSFSSQQDINNKQLIYSIIVQDTGVGIPDKIKDKLFKEYGTFDHNPGTNQHGIGLGLTICKQLAYLLGPNENIEFYSKVNEGSSFKFEIFKELPPIKYQKQQKFNERSSEYNISPKIDTQKSVKFDTDQIIEIQSQQLGGNHRPSQFKNATRTINDQSSEITPQNVQKDKNNNNNDNIYPMLKCQKSREYQTSPKLQVMDDQKNYSQSQSPKLLNLEQFTIDQEFEQSSRSNDQMSIQQEENCLWQGREMMYQSQFQKFENMKMLYKKQCKKNQLEYIEKQQNNELLFNKKINSFQNINKIGNKINRTDSGQSPKNKFFFANKQEISNRLSNGSISGSLSRYSKAQTYNHQNKRPSQDSNRTFNSLINTSSPKQSLQVKINKLRKKRQSNLSLDSSQSPGQVKNSVSVSKNIGKSQMLTADDLKRQIKDYFPNTSFKILVVDDNSYNILGVQTLFKYIQNMIIEKAFNGKQAIEKVEQNLKEDENNRYFLIFMDVNMPVLDGNQAIQHIRQKHKYPYKIISLTAFGQEEDKENSLKAGADFFMNKPLTYTIILNMLKNTFPQKVINNYTFPNFQSYNTLNNINQAAQNSFTQIDDATNVLNNNFKFNEKQLRQSNTEEQKTLNQINQQTQINLTQM